MSKTNRTAPSQREKVKFIEKELEVEYTGNISNQTECQMFIDEYYDYALEIHKCKAEYREEVDHWLLNNRV